MTLPIRREAREVPALSTIAELFRQQPARARDVLRKAAMDIAPSTAPLVGGPGSYEHFIDKARSAVTAAAPCPRTTEDGGPYHSPTVRATFADHALVGCDGCQKTWHVPFSIDDDNAIQAGDPEERVARFVDPAADDAETPEADEDDDDAEDEAEDEPEPAEA
jgi:hypothetical protein